MGTFLVLWLTGLLACSSLANSTAPTLLLTGKSGLFHLDADGNLLEYRNDTFQWWQGHHVAPNPRNGTICWVTAHEDQSLIGNVRCASIDDLSASWDLPTPKNFRVNYADAFEIDPDTNNFYITVRRVNYVCSYNFQKCAKLWESGGNVRYYAAYDIPNRLVFMITTEKFGPYQMEVMALDGSDRRQIADNSSLDYPYGLAVDSADRMVYWLDRYDGWISKVGLYRFNQDGQNKELVAKFDEGFEASYRKDLKIVGDSVFVYWGNQDKVSRVDKKTGKVTHLVDGKVADGVMDVPIGAEGFLSLNVISKKLQPHVENNCLRSRGDCGDICVPTVVNGVPSHTCFCPPNQELVDTACFEREPATVIVVHRDALQAVDVDTEEAKLIHPGLTNATKIDFFYESKTNYLLFWLDDGGLFRGRWQYGGQVTDIVTLVPPGGSIRVVEVAVDWNQRNVLWIERDLDAPRFENGMRLKIAGLNGTSGKTLGEDMWRDQSALIVHSDGFYASYHQNSWGTMEFASWSMKGEKEYSFGSAKEMKVAYKIREVAVDLSALADSIDQRLLWVDPTEGSIQVISNDFSHFTKRRSTLLTDTSLKNSGGMDVLLDRVFWTDRTAGVLMTADSETGENVRALGPSDPSADLRGVRVLHPRKQPAARIVVCDSENNGCTGMCVRQIVNWKRVGICACPDGTTLRDDGKTCE